MLPRLKQSAMALPKLELKAIRLWLTSGIITESSSMENGLEALESCGCSANLYKHTDHGQSERCAIGDMRAFT